MKNLLLLALTAFVFAAAAPAASAQQFGYVNSAAILAEMPQVKQANANLETLQQQLQKRFEASVQQLQTDYTTVQQQIERGELSPRQQEEQAAALQKRQNDLQLEEAKLMEQIETKRNELLQPIYDSLNEAIKTVAKERGMTFVFDQQVLLYAEDTQDVTADVKAKLGM